MNKVIGFLVLIVVLYVGAIFVVPDTADKIGNQIGIIKLNTFLRGAKTTVDSTVTIGNSTGGILDMYQETVDNARQVKDVYNKAVEQGQEVKNKIDTVRATLSGAEDTVNKTIETANTVIETGKEIQQKVDAVQKALNTTGTASIQTSSK